MPAPRANAPDARGWRALLLLAVLSLGVAAAGAVLGRRGRQAEIAVRSDTDEAPLLRIDPYHDALRQAHPDRPDRVA